MIKFAFCFLLAFCSSAVWAQTPGASTGSGSAPPAGSTGGTTAPGIGRTPGPIAPTTPSTGTKSTSDTPRTVFISGKVITEDGSPVPTNVTIQRVCNGNPRSVAYADSKGRFNFQWGQAQGIMMDASEAGFGTRGGGLSGGSGGSPLGGGIGGDSAGPSMNNCELRASVVGYRSESVSLFNRNSMDNPDVGTILIHRLGNVEGTSVSVTSMLAPKDAKKAYERGLQSLLKNKPDDAAKDFEKAVDVYPKYAEAWMSLGKVRIMQKANERAREALLKAIEVDAKLVSPYVELGYLAAQEQKWEVSSQFFDRALRLDPIDFPQAWYANAVANFNLKRYDAAEKNAREAVKLDPRHANPRVEYLLGLVLIEKHDYPAAATELRAYLQQAPEGADAASVKNHLGELEKALQTPREAVLQK